VHNIRNLFPASTSIDLGSGPFPKNPFHADRVFGIDLCLADRVINSDLILDQIPLKDSSANFVTAFNFVEHIPRCLIINGKTCFSFIRLMNEVHRVLVPGGIFYSHTPAYPSLEAVTDPTHVNFITELTFQQYFCGNAPNAKMYDSKVDLILSIRHGTTIDF
jgi:SAM-dependent methyltransferase